MGEGEFAGELVGEGDKVGFGWSVAAEEGVGVVV